MRVKNLLFSINLLNNINDFFYLFATIKELNIKINMYNIR